MTENIFFFTTLKNNIKFLYDNLTLREGMAMMKAHGFTTVPVLDQTGQYIGSISEGDLLWFLVDHNEADILDTAMIGDLIRPGFMPAAHISIPFDLLLDASLHQNFVPIVDDRNIFIGIVTRQSIINYFISSPAAQNLVLKETLEAAGLEI